MSRLDCKNGRWYEAPDGKTVPSVTTVLKVFPKGEGFDRWLGQADSYADAISVRNAAGERGTMIHGAIEMLLKGDSVLFNDSWDAKAMKQLYGFVNWYRDTKPEIIANEAFVWNQACGYAGTVDIICRIDGRMWLLDVKSSGDIYPSHHVQTQAYARAWNEMQTDPDDLVDCTGVLLLKSSTKKGYMVQECPDDEAAWDAFLAAKTIYHYLEGDAPIIKTPKELPTEVTL